MFDFISGFVASKDLESVVIDVGGIGFRIYTSLNSVTSVTEGENAKFYTCLSVKEDDISLFGFATMNELRCFKELITVSGVGPKMAVSVLSQMTVSEFSAAVVTGNHKLISKAKGIGPKLAQRIVLELKDKLQKNAVEEGLAPRDGVPQQAGFFGRDPLFDDAVEALTVLGYNQQKARAAVSSVYREGATLEELVKAALSA